MEGVGPEDAAAVADRQPAEATVGGAAPDNAQRDAAARARGADAGPAQDCHAARCARTNKKEAASLGFAFRGLCILVAVLVVLPFVHVLAVAVVAAEPQQPRRQQVLGAQRRVAGRGHQ